MKLGLRIDVDTLRGTRLGVPALSRLLAARGILATFFVSVGPDNMGRHLWRLRRPSFLWKMLRSNAPGLYGWDILLRGTMWPGPRIGERLADVIRAAAAAGHEVGLHAWDHHAWQSNIDTWDSDEIYDQLRLGVDALTKILGRPPGCSAAPAWRCNDRALGAKLRFPFAFNSDCRGRFIFTPLGAGEGSGVPQPQIPVTLPTYDEIVGRDGITAAEYYRRVEAMLEPRRLNVLAIHAEVEGIRLRQEFERFLDSVQGAGWSLVPLGALAREASDPPVCRIEPAAIPGREGWASCQVEGTRP